MNENMSKAIKIMSYWLAVVFLSSCVNETIRIKYYAFTLSPLITSAPILEIENKPMILIEPLVLTDYLRQPGLVIQKNEHELQISNLHRWADSLEKSAERIVRHQLETELPNYRFERQNGQWKVKPKYRVSIELTQFQIVNYLKKTVASGQFWVFDERRKLLVKQTFLIEEELTSNGYEHAISQLELSLIKLAKIISVEVIPVLTEH